LTAPGSGIARNANSPLIAANRRFTVAAASPWHEARNRISMAGIHLLQRHALLGQPTAQREQVKRAYDRRVPGA
jgi:hypothetical protein